MKERPILFNAPMVRAIIDGRKTQTRRAVKPVGNDGGFVILNHGTHDWPYRSDDGDSTMHTVMRGGKLYLDETPHTCPYGQPGDRVWVRETFCPIYPQDPNYNGGNPIEYDYAATYKHGDRLGDSIGIKKKWTPSIHMPRAASRITLEITGIRVERLQDISGIDAKAEGVKIPAHLPQDGADLDWARREYKALWESINGAGSWDANPWVWVIEFRRIKP